MSHHHDDYHRFEIHVKNTPNIILHPHRFRVKVNKLKLASLLIREFIQYRGDLEVTLSRPCIYGVFSGPVGGFMPREQLCVGCLRCTTEHPQIVSILPHPNHKAMGDSYFTVKHIDHIIFEAENGHIPIRGQGYRGPFGGSGWDNMWTDMSEIVRPTRDGIHGREFISTDVNIGGNMPFVDFAEQHVPSHTLRHPILFDILPLSLSGHKELWMILCESARHLHSFAIVPLKTMKRFQLKGQHIIPLVASEEDLPVLQQLEIPPLFVEIDSNNDMLWQSIKKLCPHSKIIIRSQLADHTLIDFFNKGIHIFHLVANYHGISQQGQFVRQMIQEAHRSFVQAGCREEVSLLGSGGIIAAEHIPKAIICGLDAIALDTAALVALQAHFVGPCLERHNCRFEVPSKVTVEWGTQRLKNLTAAWRDQLLEILGAMGLRELRRLRGEIGRALFQEDLEREAFEGIEGYAPNKT